jgi:ferritin-like metal-binding protein YciE
VQITNLKDMYIAELQELCSLEAQLSTALIRIADVASHRSLKSALRHHRQQSKHQGERLDKLLQMDRADPSEHTDQAVEALIGETDKMLDMVAGDELRDAALTASVQKIKHYEIAAYGTAAALAGQLDFRDDQRLLHDSLEEEKEMDVFLTRLAKGEINQEALAA